MKSDSWLRNIVITGLFAIPFVAIPVSESFFFPFITGKNFLFRILVEIVFAAWALLALRDPKYRPRRSPLLFAYIAFMVVLTLADMFGAHAYRSIWSNFERMEGLVGHLHYFAYFLVLISTFKTEEWWRRWFNVSIGVSVYEALFGLVQLAGLRPINQGGVRLDATFGNATYFAVYLLFHIYLCLILAARKGTSRALKYTYGGIALLHLFLLYNTATRGAILGLLGSALLVSFALLFKGEGKTKKVAAGFVAGVVLLVGIFAGIRNSSFVQNSPVLRRFASFNESTIRARTYIYPMALKGFVERPVLGWGQENYNIVFNKYYDPHLYSQEQWFDRSHNVILDWLITGGALGILTYLSLFGAALYVLFRAKHMEIMERVLFLGLLAAYFAQNLTVFDNLLSYVLFFTVLAHLHFHGARDEHAKESEAPLRVTGNPLVPQVIVAVLLVGTLYFVNARPIMAAVGLISAIQPTEGLGGSLRDFKAVIGLNTFATSEAREQLVQFGMQVARSNEVSNEDRQQFLEYARDQVLEQVAFYPDDARYRLFAGGFFSRVGLNDEGINQLKKAIELSPQKQTLHFELASAYINKRDFTAAVEVLKKAFELDPTFEEARRLYGLGLIYAGKDAEAEEILKPFGGIIIDDDRFLEAFLERKRYDYVSQIWEFRIKRSPANAQTHLGYAAALWASQKYQQSLTELNKAHELDDKIKVDEYRALFIKELNGGKSPI